MPLLHIDMQSYWISGSGRGQGLAVDEESILDADRLPFLPGRHVKGVLRDAMRWLADARGDIEEDVIKWLFGHPERRSAEWAAPGGALLSVRDARLSEGLRGVLRGDERLRGGLFRALASTAMDPDHGVARDKSLRTFRVVVPVPLVAELQFDEMRLAAMRRAQVPEAVTALCADWESLIEDALVFAPAFGGGRNKGFGRCAARLQR